MSPLLVDGSYAASAAAPAALLSVGVRWAAAHRACVFGRYRPPGRQRHPADAVADDGARPGADLATPHLPDTRPVAAAGPRTHNRLGGTT